MHVISEIAEKALSPSINDAGTAIETIAGLNELLWAYAHDKAPAVVRFERVFMSVPSDEALIEAAYGSIARHGAGHIEVAVKLRKALRDLAQGADPQVADAARGLAALAMEYAQVALPLEREKAHLAAIEL